MNLSFFKCVKTMENYAIVHFCATRVWQKVYLIVFMLHGGYIFISIIQVWFQRFPWKYIYKSCHARFIYIVVLDYDVSHLTPVNERGEEISQRRTRRDITNKKQAFYNISILGLNLHLNLTLNGHLIAPCFHIETKHSNGSTTKSGLTHRNFYHGHVISYPGSKVALSGRDRLVSNTQLDSYIVIVDKPGCLIHSRHMV